MESCMGGQSKVLSSPAARPRPQAQQDGVLARLFGEPPPPGAALVCYHYNPYRSW
jgi:hypothetical protein